MKFFVLKILWYFHICVLMFLLVYSAASKCELCYMNMFMQLNLIFFTKIEIDRIVRLTPLYDFQEICQILRSLLITCYKGSKKFQLHICFFVIDTNEVSNTSRKECRTRVVVTNWKERV